jgi:hypothetical protein
MSTAKEAALRRKNFTSFDPPPTLETIGGIDSPASIVHIQVRSKMSTVPTQNTNTSGKAIPIRLADPQAFKAHKFLEPVFAETTSKFTKTLNDKARHWKAAVWMGDKKLSSKVFTIPNVLVCTNPTANDKYGRDYAYLGIPRYVYSGIVSGMGRSIATGDTDARFKRSEEYWWTVTNDVTELATSANTTGNLEFLSVADVVQKTGHGFFVDLMVTMDLKFKTVDSTEIKSNSIPTLTINVIRGIIRQLKVEYDGPVVASSSKVSGDDVALGRSNVTPEDVLAALKDLVL